jgi:hypothetical protein
MRLKKKQTPRPRLAVLQKKSSNLATIEKNKYINKTNNINNNAGKNYKKKLFLCSQKD